GLSMSARLNENQSGRAEPIAGDCGRARRSSRRRSTISSPMWTAGMRNCEGGFGQVIWSALTEQNAPAAFLRARNQRVSEDSLMISVATALGLKIVSCLVVLGKGCSLASRSRGHALPYPGVALDLRAFSRANSMSPSVGLSGSMYGKAWIR